MSPVQKVVGSNFTRFKAFFLFCLYHISCVSLNRCSLRFNSTEFPKKWILEYWGGTLGMNQVWQKDLSKVFILHSVSNHVVTQSWSGSALKKLEHQYVTGPLPAAVRLNNLRCKSEAVGGIVDMSIGVPSLNRTPLRREGRGGSSGTSENGPRGPEFDSGWELGFFLFPFLSESVLCP